MMGKLRQMRRDLMAAMLLGWPFPLSNTHLPRGVKADTGARKKTQTSSGAGRLGKAEDYLE